MDDFKLIVWVFIFVMIVALVVTIINARNKSAKEKMMWAAGIIIGVIAAIVLGNWPNNHEDSVGTALVDLANRSEVQQGLNQSASPTLSATAVAINHLFGKKGREHVVRRGETLAKLLRERYPAWPKHPTRAQLRMTVDLFKSMNPDFSGDPLTLKAGTKVFLPTPLQILRAAFEGARAGTKPGSDEDKEIKREEAAFGVAAESQAQETRPWLHADALEQLERDAKELLASRPGSLASKANIASASNKRMEEIPDLASAVKSGKIENVKLLIEKGADINSKNNDGVTPLMSAAKEGRTEMVQFMIGKGAELNAKDADGWTALTYAKGYEQTEVKNILTRAGAKTTFADWQLLGDSVMHSRIIIILLLIVLFVLVTAGGVNIILKQFGKR